MKYDLDSIKKLLDTHSPQTIAECLGVEHKTYISGSVHAGKTTTIMRLIEVLRQAGKMVGGIIQPAIFKNGERVGYFMQDVLTGETKPFATKLASPRDGFGYVFDANIWDWVQASLSRDCSQCDFVVVDELGRLEAQNQGYMPILSKYVPTSTCSWIFSMRSDITHALDI